MKNVKRSEDVSDSIGKIEIELLKLVRHLETFGRHSDFYAHVDRAGYLALRTIDEEGAMNVNTLAELLHLDASTVARQVAVLQAGDLIDRHIDPNDRRSSVVVLTATGRRVIRSVERKRWNQFATVTRDWTLADRDRFGRLTEMLNASLVDLDNSLRKVQSRPSSMRQAE